MEGSPGLRHASKAPSEEGGEQSGRKALRRGILKEAGVDRKMQGHRKKKSEEAVQAALGVSCTQGPGVVSSGIWAPPPLRGTGDLLLLSSERHSSSEQSQENPSRGRSSSLIFRDTRAQPGDEQTRHTRLLTRAPVTSPRLTTKAPSSCGKRGAFPRVYYTPIYRFCTMTTWKATSDSKSSHLLRAWYQAPHWGRSPTAQGRGAPPTSQSPAPLAEGSECSVRTGRREEGRKQGKEVKRKGKDGGSRGDDRDNRIDGG